MYTFTPGEKIIWQWKLPDNSIRRVDAEVITYGGNGLKIKLLEDVIGHNNLILAAKGDIQSGIWPEDVLKHER